MTPTLSYEQQATLVADLKTSLLDQEFSDDAAALLRKLRKRRDILATIAKEIDDTLEEEPDSELPLPPGKAITLTSIIDFLLRDILNLLVWISIFAGLMWLLIWASANLVPVSLGGLVSSISPLLEPDDPQSPKLFSFGFLLMVTLILIMGYILAFAAYILYRPETSDAPWVLLPAGIILVLLLLASVPFVVGSLHGWLLGSYFCVIGLASRLVTFMQTKQQRQSWAKQQTNWAIPTSWIAWFGAASLLYGALLVSYAFGWWVAEGSPVLGISPALVLAGALVAAVFFGLTADRNLISIHRFYRDRK